jgi:CO/xanthine dehydrogenase Mo-binding subunit
LLKEAAEVLGSDMEGLTIAEGIISVAEEPQKSCAFVEAAHRAVYKRGGAHIVAVGTYDPPTTAFDSNWYGNPHPGLTYSAQLAVVEVDTETGQVDVKRVVSAHDVGRGINPMACRGQIQGAVVQGIGFALFEDINISETTGIPLNKNFSDYRIPSSLDAPTIEPILVESHLHPSGPFGAKGVGQDGIVLILAAIGNAIYDATGLRITKVPIKKEEIWRQLRGEGGRKIGDSKP